jgi:outer membrane lipase/esterase
VRIRSVLYAAAALLCAVQVSNAQSFNNFFAFGDSTIDSGWWKAALPANATGKAAKDTLIAASIAQGGTGAPVGGGYLMNSQVLASYFGLSAIPANQSGGTNYAISGAVDAATAANGNIGNLNNIPPGTNTNLPSTVQQITNYLASVGGRADPNALYLISSGGNDLTFANDNFGTLPAKETYLSAQAALLANEIKTLQAAGARYIIVQSAGGTSGAISPFYTSALWNDLAAAGVQFIPSDIIGMKRAVESNPTLFGFTAATVIPGIVGGGTGSACVTQTGAGPTTSGWSQWCVNTTTPSATYAYLRSANSQQTSFYADDQHFSAAGQKIEADYDYSLVVAPSEISFLAEAPVKIRAGVVNSIWNQIPISQGQPGNFHGWVTGDVSSLKMNNNSNGFPNDPGTPVNLTAGFDYRLTREWLIGAAFSLGTTTQTFSLGGDFKENEFAASLYSAYRDEPYWFNAAVTWGTLHYDVNRQVPIGISVQLNNGSTSGSDISFATELGYDFRTAIGSTRVTGMPVKAPTAQLYLTHGPVLGVILQRVHVNGYTETDQFASIGGFTALSFGDQTRNSAVSELGYQASLDLGKWQPFAKVAWNHEWASLDRSVTASLTSTVAPSYSMPAVILGRDWGTETVGARFKLSAGTTGYIAFISELAQKSTTIYGGQIGINVALNPILTSKATN